MHYDGYAFTNNGQPTIQPLNTTIPLTRIGQRGSLSEQDAKHIEALYCKGVLGPVQIWGLSISPEQTPFKPFIKS